MPSSCIVPKCKTGKRSEKIKRSVFRVPKDEELLKKWEAAIPGDIELKDTHVVCDKHFEKHYILREWIKYGSDGEIFAKAPYKRPKLTKSAIPTKFDDTDTKENEYVQPVGSPCLGHGRLEARIASPQIIHSESVDLGDEAVKTEVTDDFERNQSPVTDFEVPPGIKVEDGGSISRTDGEPFSCESDDLGDQAIKTEVIDDDPIDINDIPPACPVSTMDESYGTTHIANTRPPTADGKVPLCIKVEDGNAASRIDSESSHSESVDSNNKKIKMEVTDDEQSLGTTEVKYGDAASRIEIEPFVVSSTVTIRGDTQNGSTATFEKYSTAVPTPWSVSEQRTEEGQAVLFSYAVIKNRNNESIPVMQRCVVLNPDRTLQYFVYGHHVQTQGTQLPLNLNDDKSLLNTLEAFQRIEICNGLGFDEINVPVKNVYKDCAQQWRHRDCTLISSISRCNHCARLRIRVSQQIKSTERRSALQRIYREPFNLDRRKIVTLLKKNTLD